MDLDPIPELLFWVLGRIRKPVQFSSYLKGVYPSFSKRAAIDLEVNRERQHQ